MSQMLDHVRAEPAYPEPDATPTATCPFCDEVVALVFEANRRLLVADHLDVYPTRVCEGSGHLAQILNGRIYIKDRCAVAAPMRP